MKLKKINITLQENLLSNGLEVPTEMQKATFGKIKSGQDIVILAPEEQGKTTAMIMAAIQRCEAPVEGEIATRVLIVVKDKKEVERLIELFELYSKYTGLRIFGTHDHTDMDDDKNQLSLGNDILIGTANRLNEMFSSAGFDVNQLKMYIIDDLDVQLRNRLEPKLYRLSESIGKTQRVYFAKDYVEEVMDMFLDKTMSEDMEWLDFHEEDED
ncbi:MULTISPECIES: DEAD/DEAH box helicase [Myroides]|uniref:DEAD/DEAH box helicase n=1 Tax=Myroides albus TaxID=2562892 RepID=A0A6I3LP73_9FLAO|nr:MULTISPECIES: DEAD/DEAH box helicase [Myroides]MTG99226.1 DEAD/DEAH box helicase [Myroides albus]MVX36184.1 DEAD/DEAH box helicase [Myroides sp. LoEW2-1]UVD78684.1 DEAD/DEAH box helicase [Myroides albus]